MNIRVTKRISGVWQIEAIAIYVKKLPAFSPEFPPSFAFPEKMKRKQADDKKKKAEDKKKQDEVMRKKQEEEEDRKRQEAEAAKQRQAEEAKAKNKN